jgi:quercetin dioxygenase-like cupin family protein
MMRTMKLSDMKGGWFVGDFQPTILQSTKFEAGIKRYQAGDREPAHMHKITTEITVIIEGRVKMNGQELSKGDMILLEPGEACDFHALEDTITAVIKTPSHPLDKYLIDHA